MEPEIVPTNHMKVFVMAGTLIIIIAVIGGALFLSAKKAQKEESVAIKEESVVTREKGALARQLGEKLAKLQTVADKNRVDTSEKIEASYPWINELPLSGQDYFIYFDIKEKKFFGIIYSSANPEAAKQIAYAELRKLGVTPSQYQFSWEIKPR